MKKKIVSICIILLIIIFIGAILYFGLKPQKIIVFAYHKVVPNEVKEKYYNNDPWIDTTERFEEQMKYLYDNNYKTISMEEYSNWRNDKIKLPKKTVMITIDDGDIETYYEMLPILKKYNFKATYFMVGEKVNETSDLYDSSKKQFLGKDLINKIEEEYPNLELQSHSFGMHNRTNNIPYVVEIDKNSIIEDFNKMKEFDTDVYCYPYGVHTDTILQVLEEENYKMAFKLDRSGISQKSDNKFLIPRVGINYDTSFSTFKKWLLKQIIM